jgi:hypothetical protein
MQDVTKTVDTYFAMWNEADPARRAGHIARAWAENARYVDPLLEAEGYAALGDMVAVVHEQLSGHLFSRVSRIDMHHDQVRFAWELEAPDGTLTAAGIDVGELAPDGRLRRIAGFFEESAAA